MMQVYHVYDLTTGLILYTISGVTLADIANNSIGYGVMPATATSNDETHKVDLATGQLVPR
jgi:hypothetical protein